jgi:hypothetical protein
VATKVTSNNRVRMHNMRAQRGPTPADVRAWANKNGLDIPNRGRIPEAARVAYEKAN